jgi:2'-5' RNA ligase
MPGSTRTFVAIDLPGPHKAELRRLQDRLAPEAPGVRWVGESQLHLTLAFLGDVPDAEIDTVCRAVAGASAPFSPFELVLAGLGAFPKPGRPRVVWAGMAGAGLASLASLRAAVVAALGSAGHAPADDRFTPHITLGRIKDGRGRPPDLTAPVARHKTWTTAPFEVVEVVVYASKPAPSGSTYSVLSRAPLGG